MRLALGLPGLFFLVGEAAQGEQQGENHKLISIFTMKQWYPTARECLTGSVHGE